MVGVGPSRWNRSEIIGVIGIVGLTLTLTLPLPLPLPSAPAWFPHPRV